MELEIAVDTGMSIAQLAERFGCSKGSVRYWLGKYGLKTQNRSRRESTPQVIAARVKERLVLEAGGRCQICGYDRYQGALQFHDATRMVESVSSGHRGLAISIHSFRDGIRKCVLLCRNCRAEVEGGVTTLPIHYVDGQG